MTEQTPNALIIVPCDDCGAIGSRPSPYGKPRDLGITPPRRTILRHFGVDDFGVARAQAAQFMAYALASCRSSNRFWRLCLGGASADVLSSAVPGGKTLMTTDAPYLRRVSCCATRSSRSG
jgi:hypothetical protein